jgi:hypothetical protein
MTFATDFPVQLNGCACSFHCVEKQESVAISGPILLMCPPDILILMQMVREGATCMYYTGIDLFTREVVYVAQGLRDRKLQWGLLQTTWPVMGQKLIKTLVARNRRG